MWVAHVDPWADRGGRGMQNTLRLLDSSAFTVRTLTELHTTVRVLYMLHFAVIWRWNKSASSSITHQLHDPDTFFFSSAKDLPDFSFSYRNPTRPMVVSSSPASLSLRPDGPVCLLQAHLASSTFKPQTKFLPTPGPLHLLLACWLTLIFQVNWNHSPLLYPYNSFTIQSYF